MSQILGTIGSLWRYPIKSLLGEKCQSLHIDTRGVEGDRLYAIRDSEGKFGSGKTTRRFRKMDGLFNYKSYYFEGKPMIIFPDGTVYSAMDPNTEVQLSKALGQPVTIVRENEISHYDAGPIHIITSAALASIQSEFPDSQIDERRFRPNLVVQSEGREPIGNQWVGMHIHIGKDVILEIYEETERCNMVTMAQDELKSEPRLLKWLSENYSMNFGVYAKVIKSGTISVHDPVTIMKRT